jgi:hypothetical protein
MDSVTSSKYPRAKGFVRAVSYSNAFEIFKLIRLVSGWFFERESADSTRVIVVNHMNPQGFMPIWLTNSMSANLASTAAKFGECVENLNK